MKLFHERDISRGFCENCAKIVETTFVRRDIPFSDGKGLARNILVAQCSICATLIAIPSQSTPAIRAARDREVVSLEASLPAIYLDVMDLAVYNISPTTASDFRRPLLSYFLHQYAHKPRSVGQLKRARLKCPDVFPEKRGDAKRRLSLKVSSVVAADLDWLLTATELSKTDLIKSVVYEIHQSLLEKPNEAFLRDLRAIATYSAL